MNDKATARTVAIETNNRVWVLLEKADRTEAETEEMLTAAHASRAAWEIAGGPVEAQRGNWLIARVAVDAGRVEMALDSARRTLALTDTYRAMLADFDLAFAEEIAARAFALAGDTKKAAEHYERAQRLGEAIVDTADRTEFFRQFALPPWSGSGEGSETGR